MSGSESLDYLFSLEQHGIKLGLENIQKLCAALGHPEKTFKSVIPNFSMANLSTPSPKANPEYFL